VAILCAAGCQTIRVWNQNAVILSRLEHEREAAVRAGDRLGQLIGTRVDGQQARFQIVGNARGTLLVALSVDCGFCTKNEGAWRRLSLHARDAGVQVLWVSRDNVGRVSLARDLDSSLIADPTHWTYMQMKLGTVPQTLVVGKDGVVAEAHSGVLDPSAASKIASAIDAVAVR
jgi:hypothetical protein